MHIISALVYVYQSGNGWVGGIIKSDLPSWIMNSGANPSDFLPDFFQFCPKTETVSRIYQDHIMPDFSNWDEEEGGK